jgi:phage shock protein A
VEQLEETAMSDNSGVPTFDDVRAKIEGRSAQALGQAELDAASAEGKQHMQTEEARAQAAKAALDRIRASLRGQ